MIARALGRLRHDRRGGVLPLVAVALPALLGMGAFAVDLGSAYTASRRLQGMADAAALAAATRPDGAAVTARAAVVASGWSDGVQAEVVPGTWRADRPVDARFVAGSGSAGAPAVRVVLTAETPLFLANIFGRRGMTLSRTATATAEPMAAFSIGSRLASLDAGVANALLSALAGGTVSLSVMDHRALLGADVDIFAFSDALRTRLRLDGASYERVLAARMTSGDVIDALSDALGAAGQPAAVAAVAKVRAGMASTSLDMARLIDLGRAGSGDTPPAGRIARVEAAALLNTVLAAANGQRQLSLDLAAGVPGLTGMRVSIAIGDRPAQSPWLALTADGSPIIRTAQTRIYLESTTAVPGLAEMRLPVLVELAQGEARLASVECGSATARAATVEARPAPATLTLAEVDTSRLGDHQTPLATAPARLVQTPLLSVTGHARVATGGTGAWQQLRFSEAEMAAATVKTVVTDDAARALVASLAQGLELQVRALGLLPVNTGAVGGLVAGQAATAAPAIDAVLATLLETLGVGLGEADVRVSGMRCAQPVLVA